MEITCDWFMLHITMHEIFVHVEEMCYTLNAFFYRIIIVFYNTIDKH